jgi:S-adenosylmethionine:tRNA ribosyltransferase-isomerase
MSSDPYDYELPKELIAQYPLAHRSDARLMLVDRRRKSIDHYYVRDLPQLLTAGDCLAVNDTRVIPARLVGFRTNTRGHWEGLFLEANAQGLWHLLGKTRGHLVEGEMITLTDARGRGDLQLQIIAHQPDGSWIARPKSTESTPDILERVGRVPLPPYIRKGEMVDSDRETYQTVFARQPGAVAAPTAGLHFTPQLIEQLRGVGIAMATLTLHVGTGTFRPIAGPLEEHEMHEEWGQIGPEAVAQFDAARQRGARRVAVGTTCVRVLETAAASGQLQPWSGPTKLFIRPPYQFRAVDALMTNFHLPRTTLLVLVQTFGGEELIRQAYQEAIREEYRFYSYGDAMLIL